MTDAAKRVGVAVIGAGGRGIHVTGNLLRDSQRAVVVRSVFDPDPKQCACALEAWGSPDTEVCDAYRDAIGAAGVDWVLVFSPNAFHREHILAAFEAGRHVFSEKPLATTIDDCRAIHEAHVRTGLLFATGFVLRYSPLYRRAKSLLDEGTVGQILSIDANENIAPSHGGYIMANWRRLTRYSGPHILEKCCHDLDMLNWFSGSVPTRVASFGGRDFFVPGNQRLLEQHGDAMFRAWPDPHKLDTPFHEDTDLMDNQVAVMEFRNGVRAQFQATMSNPIPERRVYISGSEGTMIVELYASTLRYRRMGDEGVTTIDFGVDGHGGGDDLIMKALYDTMVNGTPPECSGEEGLESAVSALAIDQAAREGRVIDLEPIWRDLDR